MQLARLRFCEGPLHITRRDALFVRHEPDLQQMNRLIFRGVELAVRDAAARTDALDVARAHDGGVAHRIAMLQRALDDVGDDFHVAMRVHAKALAGSNEVLVDDAQRLEMRVARIMIIRKAEGVIGIQPTVIGVAAFTGFSNINHNLILSLSLPHHSPCRVGSGKTMLVD
jgi:hypothetical protein